VVVLEFHRGGTEVSPRWFKNTSATTKIHVSDAPFSGWFLVAVFLNVKVVHPTASDTKKAPVGWAWSIWILAQKASHFWKKRVFSLKYLDFRKNLRTFALT